jgi:transketolase
MEMRDAFADALVELGAEFPKLLVLDADLNTSSKTIKFRQQYPQRFIQVGIAEQNLFGVAAGLASEGYIAFPSTFACFAARRACDQVAVSIAFPNLNVKIPGSYAGLPTSQCGASHNAIEDIAIMRAMPHMRVVDPGDNRELRSVMRAAVLYQGPVYFRITRLTLPDLFAPDYQFQWGRGVRLREGNDVTLAGTGMMSALCLRAADLLIEQGIRADVLHIGSIKPLDAALLVESASHTGAVVTAENASTIGGFGSAVTEALSELHPVPVRRIGVQDRFVDSGGIDELFSHYGMQPKDIARAGSELVAARRRRL